MRRLGLTLIMLLTLHTTAHAEMYFIPEVIDGNTLRLLNGEKVRLIGVEIPQIAPGMTQQEKAEVIKQQQAATDYTRSMISGAKADLQFDSRLRDEEGNLLAYCWFLYPREDVREALEFKDEFMIEQIIEDWGEHQYVTFLNAAIIKAGHATPLNDEINVEHAALFNSIYHNEIIPTFQVQATAQVDLSKIEQ
ncbi:MAG: hypothetical protein KC900_08115 [Candidatus Omnitrophica bacterium]|nr:hypothetical protein [Candidatus Omnitrophota bacterium]